LYSSITSLSDNIINKNQTKSLNKKNSFITPSTNTIHSPLFKKEIPAFYLIKIKHGINLLDEHPELKNYTIKISFLHIKAYNIIYKYFENNMDLNDMKLVYSNIFFKVQ